jgi:hypothetical protein
MGFRHDVPHRKRPELSARHPVHVTLRVRKLFPDLRTRDWYKRVHKVLGRYLGREEFRVVHASIQNTHLHFLVEAADRTALSRGMQSLTINLARSLNGTGCGQVFPRRYHATQITTPRQARNALSYVLNNWRRHRQDMDCQGQIHRSPVDPFSTGFSFTGWTLSHSHAYPDGYSPLPSSPPQTDLLLFEWRCHGRLDPFQCPGRSVGDPRSAVLLGARSPSSSSAVLPIEKKKSSLQ